jgi:lysophospholipase L1-like esterase
LKKTVLLGDSITEFNPLKHNEILNLGVHGDTTENILLRIEKLGEIKCKKIILKAGINDILKKFTLEKSYTFYKKILETLEENFEEIILLSVLPIEKYSKINMKVRKLNKLIEDLSICHNLKFINLYPLFCDENFNLKKEYSTDGIHLSSEGYEVLNYEIIKLL